MAMTSPLLRLHKLTRLPRLTNMPLGIEIALLLVLKITLLTILAKAFFSEPQAKHMHMDPALVEQHMLAPAPPAIPAAAKPSSDYSPTTTEVTHDSH